MKPGRNWTLGWVVGVVVAVAIYAAVTHFWANPAKPPSIDLANVSAPVRRTVERHLNKVRQNPRSATAWGELGAVLYAYRLTSGAKAAMEAARRLDPRNARWPYLQGQILRFEAPEAALERYRAAVARCGNEPPAPRLRLVQLLAEQGRWEDVRRELVPLVASKSELPHAILFAAQAAAQAGNLPEAISLARRSAADATTARPALVLLSVLLNRTGDAAGASDAARRAAKATGSETFADPFDSEALALREDPNAFSERVHSLLAAGHLDLAGEIVKRMRDDYPDFADTWLAAGRLELLRKNPARAEEHLLRHLQMDGGSVQGWFQLGLAQIALRRDPEAVDSFRKAIERKPDFGPAWFNHGFALGRAGHRDEALASFRQAMRHNPEHLESYLLSADLELRALHHGEAEALLDRAALLSPNDPRIAALRNKAAALGTP